MRATCKVTQVASLSEKWQFNLDQNTQKESKMGKIDIGV
jgi:hypothetical protein